MTVNETLERFFGKPVVEFRMGDAVADRDAVRTHAFRLVQDYDAAESQRDLLDAFLALIDTTALDALIIGAWSEAQSEPPVRNGMPSRRAICAAARLTRVGSGVPKVGAPDCMEIELANTPKITGAPMSAAACAASSCPRPGKAAGRPMRRAAACACPPAAKSPGCCPKGGSPTGAGSSWKCAARSRSEAAAASRDCLRRSAHPEHLHHFIAQVVDHLHGDAPGLRLLERP